MNLFRITTITFSLILLVACGGGGSSASAPTAPRTPTTMEPPTDDPDTPPATNPLTEFMPTAGSSSIQAVQEITDVNGAIFGFGDVYVDGDRMGTLIPSEPMCSAGNCRFTLPTIGLTEFNLTNSTPNLSFLNDSLDNPDSQITNTQTVDDATLAIGSITGTKSSTPVEFETFAGWLDGGVFGITQVAIGASGNEEYRFFPYTVGIQQMNTNPSGTGSVTWEGVAVASTKANRTFIRGDTTVNIPDLASPRISFTFDNWHMINGQAVSGMSAIVLETLPVSGTISDPTSSGYIGANFLGTNHERIIGYFNTEDVTGAFGATRR